MNSRGKAILWATLPLLLLAPLLLWLGKNFEHQLADEQRTRVQHTLDLYSGAVQRSLDQMVGKLDSLEVFVAGQTAGGRPVDAAQFNTFTAGLHASSEWIRAFQIVSDGVITHTFPLKGNEAALGYNLMTDPRHLLGGDVVRAWKTGRETITGPLPLVQGGLGIIIRKPLPRTDDGHARLVAIVLNIAPLLAEAGVGEKMTNVVQLAIRRETGEVFFGPPSVFAHDPVTRRLSLPDGSWELGAGPLDGWRTATSNPGRLLYLAGAVIIFLLCLLVFATARRQAGLKETIQERTHALQNELAARQRTEEQVRRLHEELQRHAEELELRVAERTAELAVARDQAEVADRMKSAFLATMSHELRTPLNSIIGFTGIILQGLTGPLNPEQNKQLDMVRSSARHLLALINDVLDISKIEAGELKVALAPFDLRATIERSVATIRPFAESKRLALRLEISPTIGELVSDARRVEQILLNLLNNALKFTEQGEVFLSADVVGATVRVRITDTGIGIWPEDLANLFRPFQQVESGLSRSHEGTGLGLVICRRLAGLLGGEIQVQSEPGKGSTFTVILPLHQLPRT